MARAGWTGQISRFFFLHRMEAYEILFAMCLFHLNRAFPILYYTLGSALKTRQNYNQGQKSLDRLSLFSFIHPFTVLTLIFCLFSSGIVTPNPCIQIQFPLPTPCFNVALNSGVRASTIWINIENGERGKSLVITPQWSNTFGPDCLSKM